MDTNDEVRRRQLKRLIAKTDGGLKGVAERAGLSAAALGQTLKTTLLPEKKTGGPQSRKCLGDPAARKLEMAHKLPAGWMDWPLEAVDYEAYDALPEVCKTEAQVRMMDAIREISQREKVVNIYAQEDVKKSQIPNLAPYSEQTGSDSRAKNPAGIPPGIRATLYPKDTENASDKHGRTPRKKGGRSVGRNDGLSKER